jgi:hypothetical protein
MEFIDEFSILKQKIKGGKTMSVKLSTTLKNIELLENIVNSKLIFQFYNYLQSNNTSEIY